MDNKIPFEQELLLYPCPTVLVTSKWENIENVLTVSWTGIASSHPEYVTIAIKRNRFSYSLIKNSRKFCINIPNSDIVDKVDYCGSNSGKEVNKFSACGLTKAYYDNDYIMISECPISLICKVESIHSLGSHDLFISRVIKKMINNSIQSIHGQLHPFVYFRPYYYDLNDLAIGYYGYTSAEEKPEY